MSEPLKVYVVVKDFGYDGYGVPEYVFSSLDLAEQCRARDRDYEILELDVLDALPALPDTEPVAQREPDKLSAALFSRLAYRRFMDGTVIKTSGSPPDGVYECISDGADIILTEKPSQKGEGE